MDWDQVVTGLITIVTSIIVCILGYIWSKNPAGKPVLDPKWAEIVDILPLSTLKWLHFQLELGLKQEYGYGGQSEQVAFFELVDNRIWHLEMIWHAQAEKWERQIAEAARPKPLLVPPKSGDYLEISTICGPRQYIPIEVTPEWTTYAEMDRAKGESMNRRSA